MNKKITEKDVEKRLIRKVKRWGGRTYKFTSPTAAGVPDRMVLLNNCVFFVEVKRSDGDLTQRQVERIIELKGLLNCKGLCIPRCAVLSTEGEVNAWVSYVCGIDYPGVRALLGRHRHAGCLCGLRIAKQIDSLLNLSGGDTYEPL